MGKEAEGRGFWEDMKEKTLAIASAIVLIVAFLSCLPVYATGAGTTATVLNAAPTVSSIDLTPDDAPATSGVQVINPEPATTNKTVTITATVCDLNGWDDIVNTSVIANITGPSVVVESPVNLSFDTVVTVTTAIYKGSFNMSNHSEGDYKVEVTAADAGGLTCVGSKNFTYLYGAPVVIVTTYNFTTGAGKDKWAFRKQHFANPPADNDDPNNEFKVKEYKKIKFDDGTMQADASAANGFYAIHRFKFSIAEPESSITKLDILWDGKATHDWGTDGATLYIWNFSAGMYEQLVTSNEAYITLEGTITDNIGDYIDDDGSLIIIAEQNTAHWRFGLKFRSRLSTDYVMVNVFEVVVE